MRNMIFALFSWRLWCWWITDHGFGVDYTCGLWELRRLQRPQYVLRHHLQRADTVNHIYTFTIKATYGSSTDFVYLDDLAFKIDGVTYQNGTPTLKTDPIEDNWTVVAGGISAGGCHLNASNGFWCLEAPSGANHGATHVGGDTDTWTVELDLASALAASAPGSFKAHFTNSSDGKVGSLISESVKFGACTAGDGLRRRS